MSDSLEQMVQHLQQQIDDMGALLDRVSRSSVQFEEHPRAAIAASKDAVYTTQNVDLASIKNAVSPVFVTETEVYSGGDSGGFVSIDVSGVVPTGARFVLVSGIAINDNAGGSYTPSTIRVRKNSSSPSHFLCSTIESGLSGAASLSSTIVEIEADLTFEAEVVHQWTGTPPDAKIYVYAYYL